MAIPFFGKRPKDDEVVRNERPMIDTPNIPELTEEESAAMLTGGMQRVIGQEDVNNAITILQKYKGGKAALEQRVVNDELWWELRHWEAIGERKKGNKEIRIEPTSAWLFNGIINKHADAMDNYPEPVVLPREASDEESAKQLSQILPVVMEHNDFEQTYGLGWWEKLKHGTAVYGVFWDARKDNGLGDVAIRQIDLLNIFWEPGVTNIQDSRNLFITQLIDNDVLTEMYPQLKDKNLGDVIKVSEYIYDDSVDTSNKSVVVDWYYKVRRPDGRTVLQYVKFVADNLLYASENEDEYRDNGFYDHGEYPVVFDTLFPEKGTPCGFGYVAISKDPQIYIDKLSANIMQASIMATRPRFFKKESSAINESQFLDWSKPLVDVNGELDDAGLRQIIVNPPSPVVQSVLQNKIDEMKETTANRDVNAGSASGGVTAAAAIAALQEAGNKVSRDMIKSSYRAAIEIYDLVIELIRQFYDVKRGFRITEPNGVTKFINVDNSKLRDQAITEDAAGETLYRKPIFDLKVRAQKTSPFSRMEMNERAKELYQMGFFAPGRAQEAQGALEMMDFEGIDKIKEYVRQGDTLMNIVQQQSKLMEQMAAALGLDTAQNAAPAAMRGGGGGQPSAAGSADGMGGKVLDAMTPMTGYGERLAMRSSPNMNLTSNEAAPRGN